MPEVLSRSSYPILTDFAGGKGTPLVVNDDNGRGYVLVDNEITPLGGPPIDSRDFSGMDPLGVTDSTVGMQAFLDEVTSGHYTGNIHPGDYLISSTLTVETKFIFAVIGLSLAGSKSRDGAFGVRLIWNGSAGGTLLQLGGTSASGHYCRDSLWAHVAIVAASGKTLGVGIDLDGDASTNNVLRHVAIDAANGTLTTGLRLANTAPTGCDLLRANDCWFAQASTAAVKIVSGQSKKHTFYSCTFSANAIGIWQADGSFECHSPNFSNNGIDVQLDTPNNSIGIYNPLSEGAGRFLYSPTDSSDSHHVTIVGGQLNPNALHADNQYVVFNNFGPLTFIGTNFAGGVYSANWRVKLYSTGGLNPTSGTSALFIGCEFPNMTPINALSTPHYELIGCQGVVAASGHSDTIMTYPRRAGVVATASLPAAANPMDGTILIEDAGAGDRNLIIYAGGQRFRIDGGANV
jgi:hypothetical protein